MKKMLRYLTVLLFFLTNNAFAWHWMDAWKTPDQQGAALLKAGKAKEASQIFKNKAWQGVALYRSEEYAEALKRFKTQNSSDGQYNAGNAAAYLGHYQDAIKAYDKAIALNPDNTDAITNREIVKKIMENQNNKSCPKSNTKKACSKDEKKQNNNSKNDSQSQSQQDQKNTSNDNKSSEKNDKQKEEQQAQADKQKNVTEDNKHNSKMDTKNNDKNLDPAPPRGTTKESETNASNEGQQLHPVSQQNQAQQENQNQLLRRLSDNPGGLLQQKFLRDYYRRHAVDVDSGGTDVSQ